MAIRLGSRFKAYHPSPCFYLLAGLLVLVCVHPFFRDHRWIARTTMATFALVVLIGAMIAVRAERRQVWIAVGLGVPTFIGAVVDVVLKNRALDIGYTILGTIFFLHVTIAVLSYVVRGSRVTADKLFGAACGYLLVGITWTMVYSLVTILQTGAFRQAGAAANQEPSWSDLLYFSYATLTTLGYGDITPTTPGVRSLAVMEAISGVLYMGFLIARLVAMYSGSQLRSATTEPPAKL